MKNHYLPGLLLALLCFIVFTTRAQTYTSGNLTVAITGDTIYRDTGWCGSSRQVSIIVTKTGSFTNDMIDLIDTAGGWLYRADTNFAGTTPWTSYAFSLNSWVSDQYLTDSTARFYFPVYKFVSGSDTIYIDVHPDSLYIPSPCEYGNVTGRVYADNNGNCIYDAGDTTLWNVWAYCADTVFSSYPAGYYPTTNYSTGIYTFNIQKTYMTGYTVALDSNFAFIFPPGACSAGPYTFHTLPQSNVDFPLQCSANIDLQCWAGSPGKARPARAFFLEPYVNNIGCIGVSGTLTLVKDHRVAYDSSLSAYPAEEVHGDTLIWHYYDLSSISAGAYWNSFMSSLYMTPDSSVTMGDTLCFHIFTDIPSADINPANNDQMVCIPVVTSYDPNEKEVSPAGYGPTGATSYTTDELTYTIHFQNTGMAEAIDIHVTDTLDSHVDPSSLKILASSHLMNARWLAPNVVDFQFPNIWLADSFDNEPASHGYVRFKVKLNTHVLGTQIKNKGYIYFDTNPAVITNETITTLAMNTYVPNITAAEVKVYPNPASDAITVENLQDGQLSIINMNGSVVLQQNISGTKTEININRLPTGVYVLKTINKTGTTTRKFVKE